MKSFIAAFDPYHISDSTLQYGVVLAKDAYAQLCGSFVRAFYYPNYALDRVMSREFNAEEIMNMAEESNRYERELSAREFQKACQLAGIDFTINKSQLTPLNELRYDSMFADLLIVDKTESFPKSDIDISIQFIRDLLAESQCPVVLVPKRYQLTTDLCLLYDGSPGALFSIKIFGYLFEDLRQLPLKVFCVNEHESDQLYLPNNLQARSLISRSFPNATFMVVKGEAKKEIPKYLSTRPKGTMVIMGGHQRNSLSMLFRRSLSELLITELDMPLFISNHI